MRARRKVHVFEQALRTTRGVFRPGYLHRYENIFERGERGDQVKGLKDESYLFASKLGQLIFAHSCDLSAIDANLARRRRVESGYEAEQGRFTAARRADYRNELRVGDGQVERMKYGQCL